MLLPDKHIRLCESILGLAALVVERLEHSMTFDSLMKMLEKDFESSDWPAYHDAESVSLALCFLYAAGLVDVSPSGEVFRCG